MQGYNVKFHLIKGRRHKENTNPNHRLFTVIKSNCGWVQYRFASKNIRFSAWLRVYMCHCFVLFFISCSPYVLVSLTLKPAVYTGARDLQSWWRKRNVLPHTHTRARSPELCIRLSPSDLDLCPSGPEMRPSPGPRPVQQTRYLQTDNRKTSGWRTSCSQRATLIPNLFDKNMKPKLF